MDSRRSAAAEAASEAALAEAAEDMRRAVRRAALASAAASFAPIPGADAAADAAALAALLSRINEAFRLSPGEIAKLSSEERLATAEALSEVGARFAGRYITGAAALFILKSLGRRWLSARAARWIPVAGQAAAAAVSYFSIERLGREHIAECLAVRARASALLAGPGGAGRSRHQEEA